MKWQVKIPVKFFMCGIHEFSTKKAAVNFATGYCALDSAKGAELILYRGRATKDERNAIERFSR